MTAPTVQETTGSRVSRRKRLIVGGAVVVAATVVGVLVWFQPQKLFIDETVNEVAPAQTDAMSNDDPIANTDPMSADVLSGSFSSLAHETTGKAVVHTSEDGSRFLRLEGFETSNGPDLRVYLSTGDEASYGKDFVDLGGLKGNKGDQNYLIPSGTELEKYDTAVIWCRRFTVAFGAAELA